MRAGSHEMSGHPLEWAEGQSHGNISALISSLHVPPCNRRCRNPLVDADTGLLHLDHLFHPGQPRED